MTISKFPNDATYKHFQAEEFDHPDKLDPELLLLLDWTRADSGVPFIITSDYRTPEHNKRIGGSPYSLHPAGLAVDWVTPASRLRDKRAFQVELFEICFAFFLNAQQFEHRRLQFELVQGPTDWHLHLGMYPVGDEAHPNRLILAVD